MKPLRYYWLRPRGQTRRAGGVLASYALRRMARGMA